jgi:peptide chain release factor 2/peptide chain release factor
VAQLAAELSGHCQTLHLALVSTTVHGDESAPRSVEIELQGDAPMALASSIGTHVLVARSGRRGRRSRKRWFAGVSMHPAPQSAADLVELRPADLEITTARAGGPGGQHVNTTDSAVRVRHKATGVSVRVASERSQHHNRRRALERLRAILGEREQTRRGARQRDLRLSHYQFERGSAVQQWTTSTRGPGLERI